MIYFQYFNNGFRYLLKMLLNVASRCKTNNTKQFVIFYNMTYRDDCVRW